MGLRNIARAIESSVSGSLPADETTSQAPAFRYPKGGVPPNNLAQARALVLRYGWNATAFQIVNPGIEHWGSGAGDALIGFVRHGRHRVVAGAPICDEGRLADVVEEWEQEGESLGERTCYFGAAGRLVELLRSRHGYSIAVLGSQPVWNPSLWPDILAANASLRAQLNRSRNKGVWVEEWDHERATDHPDLRRVLAEWLQTRGLPPLHFLVEPQTLGLLEGRRIFVAQRGTETVGFLVASPVPLRNGWLTEQFVRGRRAVNGTVELMVDHAMTTFGAERAEYVTMGLVPLSLIGVAGTDENPLWLRLLTRWVRAHGRRFYNFVGLETFKAKLKPHDWEPIFVISKEPKFSVGTLYAITGAFTKSPPMVAVFRGLAKALRQEWRWILRKGQ